MNTLRKMRGLTQEELAKKVGVSNATIGFYETGKRTPRLKTIKKLALALRVSEKRIIDCFKEGN